jgi:hypothetical protein
VGKTGGIALEKGVPIRTPTLIQTLKCIALQTSSGSSLHDARQFCLQQYYPNQRSLAQLTRHVLAHKHLYSSLYEQQSILNAKLPNLMGYAMEHLDTILVTTRNPVDRIVSAFNYHRNELVEQILKNKMQGTRAIKKFEGKGFKETFYNCFPDVRYMAEELAGVFHLNRDNFTAHNKNTAIVYNQMTCGQLAHAILSGKKPEWAHYSCNYQWYKKLTIDERPDVPILVVRTENLWQDATAIEVALGGNASNFINAQHTMSHGSERYAVTAKLETTMQKQAICCAIHEDLQAYQDIVLGALNLNDREKEEMMNLVREDCHVNADEFQQGILNGARFWEEWFMSRCNLDKIKVQH